MYMAPEQALGETIDQRADLFSLGSVLYVMCSGRPPFRAANTMAVLKRVAEDTPRPIREIIPEVPEWLCELISRLHAKNPADRITSAQEVADLLAQTPGGSPAAREHPRGSGCPEYGDGEAAAVRGDRGTRPGVRRSIPKRRWAAAAAVLVLFLGSLGFTEATGVTDFHGTVIRLFSPEGTLVVEVDDPGVSVKIDGADLVITGAGVRKSACNRVATPSKRARTASSCSKNWSPSRKMAARSCGSAARHRLARRPRRGPPTRPPGSVSWPRLSAAEQVRAVAARLKELNPSFDAAVVPTIENGVVRELELQYR